MSAALDIKKDISSHCDADYFQWQSEIGMLVGSLEAEKFSPFIKGSDNILDFGCGGGFLLASLQAEQKTGVEINFHARACAKKRGIKIISSLDALADE